MDIDQRAEAARPSVLLVEDEPDLRFLVRENLHRSGRFEVEAEAADGEEAIALLEDLQPDIVLLDIMMPGMNGRQALPRILVASPTSMVVMLSALDAVAEERPALAAGAFAYLEKRVIGPELPGVLDDLYRRFLRALSGETVVAPGPL
ncbi:MAG: response regulator [Actinomycetes bacterium]